MKNINQDTLIKHKYEDDNIDLIALAKTVWGGRTSIIKTTLIFICIGFFVAITTPAVYTSSIILKPILSDSNSKLGGGISGLAAMAGINLGGSSGSSAEIHPTLYPKIFEDYNFQKELMESPLFDESLNSEISFAKYYSEIHKASSLQLIKKYTLGLPALLLRTLKKSFSKKNEITWLNNNEFEIISETDQKLMQILKSQLSINVNEKKGFVSISANMPYKIHAAQMAKNVQNILQRKVIEHKIKKAEEDLAFIEERFLEKKMEFELAQKNLATYLDANKNVNTAIAKTQSERLESEFQLAFSVYSELAKQVESQKIRVKENTPVFVILQDAVIPLNKSNTSKSLILVVYSFLGIFLGIFIAFARPFIADIKKEWNNK